MPVGPWRYLQTILLFPSIKPYHVDSRTAALEAVAIGKADATVAHMGLAQNIISREGMQGLKFVLPFSKGNDLHFGVRNDWPELSSILDKALASITDQERQQIFLRWTTLAAYPRRTSLA